ncbi:hypothetical protein QFC22_003460 [Naganishia vaughanmartiniae]|uniref:Uncharacterized protein n=1 Tax=Naganishia vaughanmartiniae TaxID=1424756 RepID=A0ACC2X828_9TREE|nr:hypothetical protein QFC22_003460 [Naganishia vaughanmartiniae]
MKGFNPFNPPAPPPAKPPAPEKKEPAKPPANTGPLRMMILIGAGKEALLALLALPPNYTQAVKDATEKFEIPKNFHVRLAVKRGEEPSWLSKFVQQDFLFL